MSPPENGSQGANESAAIEDFLIAWKKLKEEVHRREALQRLLAEPGVTELLAEIQSELAEDNQEAGELDGEEK